jgi:hypothetical protein
VNVIVDSNPITSQAVTASSSIEHKYYVLPLNYLNIRNLAPLSFIHVQEENMPTVRAQFESAVPEIDQILQNRRASVLTVNYVPQRDHLQGFRVFNHEQIIGPWRAHHLKFKELARGSCTIRILVKSPEFPVFAELFNDLYKAQQAKAPHHQFFKEHKRGVNFDVFGDMIIEDPKDRILVHQKPVMVFRDKETKLTFVTMSWRHEADAENYWSEQKRHSVARVVGIPGGEENTFLVLLQPVTLPGFRHPLSEGDIAYLNFRVSSRIQSDST